MGMMNRIDQLFNDLWLAHVDHSMSPDVVCWHVSEDDEWEDSIEQICSRLESSVEEDEYVGGIVSMRKSALKEYGGDMHNLNDSTRLDHECVKTYRSRDARHSCRKDKKSYRPYRMVQGKPSDQVLAMIKPIPMEVFCEEGL